MPKRERLSNTASGDHFTRRDDKGRLIAKAMGTFKYLKPGVVADG